MSGSTGVRVYEKRSVFKTTLAKIASFHQDASALAKLTPPPIFVQVRSDRRTSLTSGTLDFTLWFLFFPVRWTAEHEPVEGAGFADVQRSGPMAAWRHEHLFELTADGVALTDRVTFSHRPGLAGLATRLLFDGIPLRFLFIYRHWRTRRAVEY